MAFRRPHRSQAANLNAIHPVSTTQDCLPGPHLTVMVQGLALSHKPLSLLKRLTIEAYSTVHSPEEPCINISTRSDAGTIKTWGACLIYVSHRMLTATTAMTPPSYRLVCLCLMISAEKAKGISPAQIRTSSAFFIHSRLDINDTMPFQRPIPAFGASYMIFMVCVKLC